MSLELKSANGSILLSSEDGTGQAQVTLPRGGFLGDSGYQWVDESTNRQADVTYTNTTGKPIFINVIPLSSSNQRVFMYVGNSPVDSGYITASAGESLTVIVPKDAAYRLSTPSGVDSMYWFELK